MSTRTSIHTRTIAPFVLAVIAWGLPAMAQPQNPPLWWGQDDDRTTCVNAPFNNPGDTPDVTTSPNPAHPDPAVYPEGDAGWIDEVAGHTGVMGVEGAGQRGSVVIFVWNGEAANSEKHVWLQYDSYVNQGAIGGPSLSTRSPSDSVGFHSPPPNSVDLGNGWSRHWREWTIKPQPIYEEIEFTMGTVPSGGSSAAAVIDNVYVGTHCENGPNPPEGKVAAFSMAEDVFPPDPVYVECTSPGYEATVWTSAGSFPPIWMPNVTSHDGVLGMPALGVPADGVLELWVDDLSEPGGIKHVSCQFDFYMAEGGILAWDPPEVSPECVMENFQMRIYDLPDGWQRCLLTADVSPPPDWELYRWVMFSDPASGPIAIDSVIVSSGYLFPDNWLEQFDIYDAGIGLHGQGGWKGWDNDPIFDAAPTDVQSFSVFNALDVVGDAGLVHEFVDHTKGRWAFSCWTYVPSDFDAGPPGPFAGSYILLMNTYEDGFPHEEDYNSVQMNFDSNDGMLKVYYGNGLNTVNVPYVPDEWIEISVSVDLDIDMCTVYYDDAFVAEYPWSGGIYGSGIGAHDIAAVGLFANGATSIYYDDLHLCRSVMRGDMNCDGVVDLGDIEPFALCLIDPVEYAAAYPDCSQENADVNDDDHIDGNDIQEFVQILTGGW